ncbi:phytanoyl-CoA dioxygenase family protein [Actinacidiphila acidipaludis]|uniref:Phytanoyl-CoA dioxygenase family protein n=1 Tax=Actinacidiphila acidipaludis TaxID=2873382 RepID=A0ABS7QIZ8_9ACTN|nr:phytanoyl-CoA dioxygenase family protein [Streptomyces acidipaludis]MBY8883120.1 phytanoyl-CoA dioxygenase family protein [Streptomyces acidipaludis]
MPTAPDDLRTPYALDPAALRHFGDHGFVHLTGVVDPATVAAYEPEVTAKVIDLNTQHLPLAERDTYGKAFLQVTNLWQHSEKVRELVFAERLAGIAAALLGVPSVRLYHDQALYKEPGGGITPWHADQYYWPLSTDRTVTVWLPLQETPAAMGPLAFAAGSHRFEHGRDLPISDASERELQKALAERDFPLVEEPYGLGDASFHGGWTFHRAAPNHSGEPRRVMTVIYMDARITVSEPTNDFQRADLRTWMPGTAVGATPESPLNPVLYPA